MALATGDCEAIHTGLLAQPVNALTSLAYVGVGAWLLWRGRGTGSLLYGLAVVAVGIGSFDYHGPQSPWAHGLHDASLGALGGAVVVRGPAAWRHRSPAAIGLAVAALAAGGVLQAFGRTGGPLCAPDSLWQAHGGWHVLTAAALAAWGYRVVSPRKRSRPARPTAGSG